MTFVLRGGGIGGGVVRITYMLRNHCLGLHSFDKKFTFEFIGVFQVSSQMRNGTNPVVYLDENLWLLTDSSLLVELRESKPVCSVSMLT